MAFFFEPPPYQTSLSTDKRNILSVPWVKWLSQVLNNVGIISTIKPAILITENMTLNAKQYDIVCDASSNSIDITLPDSVTFAGKEYRIHGYNATNSITIFTTDSQQIRLISTDTSTSKAVNSGDVVVLVSLGGFWKIC